MPEQDVNLDEDNSKKTELEVKMKDESSKSLSWQQMMRTLPPHHVPLKDRFKDKIVPYRDLLRLGPPPSDLFKKYAKLKYN